MKKQSGFTLIELMVVMAIIAILATAGLSAYTGYIKKARDATRIADLRAINNIVLASMSSTGLPPTFSQLEAAILAANNNQELRDPLYSNGYDLDGWTGHSNTNDKKCIKNDGTTGFFLSCGYSYGQCDSDTGYIISAMLESPSNKGLLTENLAGPGGSTYLRGGDDIDQVYDVGSCKTIVSTNPNIRLFET